jgi:oligopeptidase B
LEGRSAGGLTVGAAINLRPDLYGFAHLGVPFVDVINTMLDASIPLTTGEYREWGNPNEPEAFGHMHAYSPYDNLTLQAYPSLLLTTGINDMQVRYSEPVKYAAKMRALNKSARVAVRINMGVGHGGASGRYAALEERAEELALMLWTLGIYQ